MNRRSLAALVALNIALLIALLVVHLSPSQALAQGGGRRDYIMLSGAVVGREAQEVIYIIELRSSKMAAVIYNSATNTFEVAGARVLSEDLTQITGGH